jgi:hypothetical protein
MHAATGGWLASFSATTVRAPRHSSSRAGGHVDVAHVGIDER